MSDERMQSLLDAWYRDRDEAPRDPSGGLARVMDKVPQVRQRSRWWPLPVFDRPVSTFPGRGPAPAPIPATDGRQPARGFTMFSAVKFVVAGVIVALFGGFLAAGLLTTQRDGEMAPATVTGSPSPMTTDGILPGVTLTVEAVEPGVYRVIDDGVRDLAKANNLDIVAGQDGGIYLLRPQRFVRLGSDEWQAWDTKKPEVTDFEVAPDATVWTVQQPGGVIQSFAGEEWTAHDAWGTLEVAPDGTVWSLLWDPEQGHHVLGYLDQDGWQALSGQQDLGPFGSVTQLYVAGRDDIWAKAGTIGPAHVLRFVDGAWQRLGDGAWQRLVGVEGAEATWQQVGGPAPDDAASLGLLGLGPDGTLWGASSGRFAPYSLVRFDGTEWQEWTGADLVQDYGGGYARNLTVAPDGSVWSDWWWNGDFGFPVSEGVAHFDGIRLSHYLLGRLVRAMDVAADGSLWLLADDDPSDKKGVLDLYVITPEAVAATE